MHEDRAVVLYHTRTCAQCFEKDVVHLAQRWRKEKNLSVTRGFDPQTLRLCVGLLQPLSSLTSQANQSTLLQLQKKI